MRRSLVPARFVLAVSAFFLGVRIASSDAADKLQILKSFEPGGSGKWDYLTVDPAARRLYVSRENRVMVLDADQGSVLGEVTDTPGVHGIAIVSDRNEGYTSNGKENMLSVFDLKSLKTLRKVKAGTKPDSIIYDPASKCVFAFNGNSGNVTIVDPSAPDATTMTLPVGGKLETGVSDGAGHVYVNVEDKSEIVAIDVKARTVTAHWSIAPGEEPTGLAIDPMHRRLFAGCANKKMIVLDADSGRVLASLPIGAGVDGTAFDPKSGVAMSANGRDGTLTAIGATTGGKYEVVQTAKTAKSARTIAYDSASSHVYLPCTLAGKDGESRFAILVVGAASDIPNLAK